MRDKAYVTNVTMETTEDGIEVEVRVIRTWMTYVGIRPLVEDVPADVRAALAEWLGVVPNEGNKA